MSYVLILILSIGLGSDVTISTQEYSSEHLCNEAKTVMINALSKRINSSSILLAQCQIR